MGGANRDLVSVSNTWMDARAHPAAFVAVSFSRLGAASLPDYRYFSIKGCRRRWTHRRLLRRSPKHAISFALRLIASIYLSSLGCIAPVMRYRHLIKVNPWFSIACPILKFSLLQGKENDIRKSASCDRPVDDIRSSVCTTNSSRRGQLILRVPLAGWMAVSVGRTAITAKTRRLGVHCSNLHVASFRLHFLSLGLVAESGWSVDVDFQAVQQQGTVQASTRQDSSFTLLWAEACAACS